jgi:TolB-like protein
MTVHKATKTKAFRFTDCEVDLSRREIRRYGTPVIAEPQTFELLAYLIENRDRVIDKLELRQAVWAGISVSSAALKQCIAKIRRLVGDDPSEQAVIKTVHGHGYRFVAELKDSTPGEAEVNESPAFDSYQEALRSSDQLTIAVLPFKDLGNDPRQAYFAEGINGDVITELSRFTSLFVISPNTMTLFKDPTDGIQALAQKLGVAYVVQGTIRRSESRIRITVHLTEASSERRLWSEHYDRELEEIPIIQDDVARTIAATIGGRVEAHRSRQRFDEAGVKAYDLILHAKALHYSVSKSANAEARILLERAIKLDPNNARAYAWLTSVHGQDAWSRWTEDPEKSFLLALEAGRMALTLDDSDYIAQVTYAELMHEKRDYTTAQSHFIRAIELNPNDITARSAYSLFLVSTGQAEEALQHMTVAERLDPFGLAWTPWAKGAAMFGVGRYQDAIRCFSQVERLENMARPWLSAAYSNAGDLDQARIVLEKFLRAAQDDMTSFPGKDAEVWKDCLRKELLFQDENDFDDFFRALADAGWEELIDALPNNTNQDGFFT